MNDLISVIIPTHNPDTGRLNQTLNGLKRQELPYQYWELVIIDNNSMPDFAGQIDLSWHPAAKIIFEPKQGLTYARLKGFSEAKGNLVVMFDDDNIPDENYLSQALKIFKNNLQLGAIGGKSLPLFEAAPPQWLSNFYEALALRDMGENDLSTGWNNEYPAYAPIGAGMCIKKEALKPYIDKITSGDKIIQDRTGNSLSSGGDNDIVIEILRSGWQVGYFPALALKHIIPEWRMQVNYLAKLMNNTNRSWVQVLRKHNINPWNNIPVWSRPLRKIKAWLTYKAWKNEVNYIKWRGTCGSYDGLSE